MATTISKQKRKEIEKTIIEFFDILDKSGTNSNYYREVFSDMSDAAFIKFISSKYPFKFQLRQTKTEPTMDDVIKACEYTGVPLLENIYLPYLYRNKEGKAVRTAKCLVGYIHMDRVQQIVTKKSKWSTEIENRDMRSGRLIGDDKGAGTSDREFESLVTFGLTNTMFEFAKPKADYMKAKSAMNAAISTKGYVTQADIPDDPSDSLSKNMVDVYMMSALLETNLTMADGYTAYSLKNKSRAVERL